MVFIPEKFTENIKEIIEWHLATYVPDIMFDIHLNRILERFSERNMVDGMVELEESELYYINECASDATNNVPECGVEESIVWDIYNWVVAERKKVNI